MTSGTLSPANAPPATSGGDVPAVGPGSSSSPAAAAASETSSGSKSETKSETKSEEQLRLVVAFHYAFALLTIAKLVLGLPLLIPGIAGFYGPDATASADAAPGWFGILVEFAAYSFDAPGLAQEPQFIALLLMMTGATLVLVSVVHGATLFWIGRCIQRRSHRRTVVFFSWMDLTYFPFGTVLSIAFLILYRRPDVREMFLAAPRKDAG